MVCARLIFLKIFIFIFSPRRSRRGTLGISSPGGPVEEPLKPFCSFFSLCRLSSSVVFQWGSLRQTLDLSKTTNEKVPWRRPSTNIPGVVFKLMCPWKWYRKPPILIFVMIFNGFYGNFPSNQPSATKGVGSFEAGLQGASNNISGIVLLASTFLASNSFWHQRLASPQGITKGFSNTTSADVEAERSRVDPLVLSLYSTCCCGCCCCCWWW